MSFIIKIVGFASGAPCPHTGQFVKSFDHEAYGGLGFGTFTDDPKEALSFESQVEAFKFWRQQSFLSPTRIDGKPNRPLTAATVVIYDPSQSSGYVGD